MLSQIFDNYVILTWKNSFDILKHEYSPFTAKYFIFFKKTNNYFYMSHIKTLIKKNQLNNQFYIIQIRNDKKLFLFTKIMVFYNKILLINR